MAATSKKTKTNSDLQLDTKVTKSITSLILDQPFFGSLLLRMKINRNDAQSTMSTDGKSITYSSDFVLGISDKEVQAVFAHEVCHCILTHQLRRGEREHRRWNIACDYAVNLILEDCKFKLPGTAGEDYLLDHAYKDMSAEEIFEKMPQGIEDQLMPEIWMFGVVEDTMGEPEGEGGNAVGLTQTQLETETREWLNKVAEAANAAKMMGRMSASLERMIDNILDSRLPWQELLARFLHSVVKNDFNWSRPNRTMMNNYQIYLPTLWNEACGSIVLAVDTSGSIGQIQLDEFNAELNGILDQVRPEKVTVIYADADVKHIDEYTPDQYPVTMSPHGGGGTDFRPVFEHTNEHIQDVQCLIYLTDMMGTFPEDEPDYPVMWITNSTIEEAPFGQVVKL